jgi:hypothetical protein
MPFSDGLQSERPSEKQNAAPKQPAPTRDRPANHQETTATSARQRKKPMPFTEEQTQSLLAVKGIGKTVLQRLQQMGLDDVAKLAAADADTVLRHGAALTGSTCWKNSPQAKAAVNAAIQWARQNLSDGLSK